MPLTMKFNATAWQKMTFKVFRLYLFFSVQVSYWKKMYHDIRLFKFELTDTGILDSFTFTSILQFLLLNILYIFKL